MIQKDYILQQLENLMAIDSPTGFTARAAEYVMAEYSRLGFAPLRTNKGGIVVQVGGYPDASNALLMQAHLDTLGAMVSEIKPNGTLRLTPLGGMNANNAEGENLRIYTHSGDVFTGTCQLSNPSVHVNSDYNTTPRNWDTMEAVVDDSVCSKADALALGFSPGNIVAFEPRLTITPNGYIKSRFLDDKLCVAILLGYARQLKHGGTTSRPVYHHITVFEEVGHGGSATVPEGVTEVLGVDMGCIGEGLTCTEKQVSICAKDKGGPYNYEVVSNLIGTCKNANIDYAVDVYPFYGSDANATLYAGHDVRHGLIGPGVYASHGYERAHISGMMATYKLLMAYVGAEWGPITTDQVH